MRVAAVLVACAAIAWWLCRRIVVQRRVEPTTLDRLRKVIKPEAA